MTWPVALSLLGIGVVLLVLLAPIEVAARGRLADDALEGEAEARWSRWLVVLRVGPGATARARVLGLTVWRTDDVFRGWGDDDAAGEKAQARRDEARRRRRPAEPLGCLGADRRRALVRMARDAWRALHPTLRVRGTVGLGDPADTAWVVGAARALGAHRPRAIEVDLRDDFLTARTDLEARLGAWLVPIEVGWIALVWAIRPDTRRVLWRGR